MSAAARRGRGAVAAVAGLLRAAWLALALLLGWAAAGPARAHDVPTDTHVRAFARVEADRLLVLVRMPLGLLLNANLPKQGPGYLALGHLDEGIARAVAALDEEMSWHADGRRLVPESSRARISMPADASFASFEQARAHIQDPPLPASSYVFWNQGYLDVQFAYPLESPDAAVAVDFRVAPALRDRVRLDLRYGAPGVDERAFELPTAEGPVTLDPRWHQAARTFVGWGFEHILGGPDHLLFLLCLVLPYRRLDLQLVGVVSAFTVAHSVTLVGAAYGLAPAAGWFPPLVETAIAASILFMAIENVVHPRPRRRWLYSTLFGLVHGFGFSFLLQSQLQFAGSNLLLSLLAFNVGVELGQLLVLVVVLPALAWWHARRPETGRAMSIVVCALAGHAAWHWLVERLAALRSAWGDAEAAGSGPTSGIVFAAVVMLAVALGAAWSARRRRPTRTAIGETADRVAGAGGAT